MGLFERRLQSGSICRRLDNCSNSERSSRRFIKTTASSSPTDETVAADMMTYQNFDQKNRRTISSTLGHREFSRAHFWISLLTECLSCYIYVFIVCSTRISWTGSVIGHEPNLLAMAFSSGIAMMLLILIFRTVHANPALTIAFFFTGRIPLVRMLSYVLVQCLGSVAAVTTLYSISVKGHAGALGLDNPHDGLSSWQILVVEILISFVVTLTIYATCNYSSYTSARQFILEHAVTGQNAGNGGLLYSDLFFASSACDNIAQVTASGSSSTSNAPTQPSVANGGGAHLTHANHALNGSSTAPHLAKTARQAQSRIHPQQQQQQQQSGFLSEIYANDDDMKESDDYGYEYDNGRMYANTKIQQRADSSPTGHANKVPPIEELMQNESQLLATNGFSLHVTVGQALVIGLAYALTSLSGIPASGASLNPARSFGPAFIMNRWDRHWIYWFGPILGAIVAGFFYEFIFNPTRNASLCYLPKLFRLSAHDMAKVCSKSRLFHQRPSQKLSPFSAAATAANLYPNAPSVYRPQLHPQMLSTIQHSPSSRLNNGFMSSATLANHQHQYHHHHHHQQQQQQQLQQQRLAQLHTSHLPFGAKDTGADDISYQQRQQQQALLQDANFDRSKSSAIINLIASKQQQSRISLPHQQRQTSAASSFHCASSSNGSSSHASSGQPQRQDFDSVQPEVVYDDPGCGGDQAPNGNHSEIRNNSHWSQQKFEPARRSMMLTAVEQSNAPYQLQTKPFHTMQQTRPLSMQFSESSHMSNNIIQQGKQTMEIFGERSLIESNDFVRDERFYHVPDDQQGTG